MDTISSDHGSEVEPAATATKAPAFGGGCAGFSMETMDPYSGIYAIQTQDGVRVVELE